MGSLLAKMQDMDWWQVYEQVKDSLQERNTQYALVGGVVVALIAKRLLSRSKYNLPPGPRGLPLLGNIISCRNTELMEANLTKWRKQYGDVFTIYMGPMPFVILATAPAIREAFITKGNDFAGRYSQPSFERFTDGFKDIILSQPGPVWKLQRQIAHSAIRKYASGHLLEDNLQGCMDSLVEYMDEHPDKIVDIPELMLRLTYNFLGTVCYGKQYGMQDQWVTDFIALIKEVTEIMGSGFVSDFFPSLKFLDKAKFAAMDKAYDIMFGHIENEFEEHKKTLDADCPRDFTDELLIQMQKIEESGESKSVFQQVTKSHLIQTLADVFSAGTDTSRITLSILVGYMVEYPEVQVKLQKELDDVLGDDGKVTLKLKDELPYTNAVVHEAMRYKTVAPVGVPHQTTCDTSLGDYTMPKGTKVMAYTHGVHRDPANYPDPDTFKPERWLDANGKFQYKPYIFIPFSMGPRVCVGESLARADLQLFTAMLFHKYKFTSPEDNFKLTFLDVPLSMDTKPFKLKLTARH